jgi:hypothetical protein
MHGNLREDSSSGCFSKVVDPMTRNLLSGHSGSPRGIGRFDRERAECDNTTAVVLPAALCQSAFDGSLLISSVEHESRSSDGTYGYCVPRIHRVAHPLRETIPQLGCDGGIAVNREKTRGFHRGWNRNDKGIIDRDDHAGSACVVTAEFQSPANGFFG